MARYPEFREIVDALQLRVRDVATRYAPGGGHEQSGKWWAINPGRADRHVGSFYINLTGAYAGRWHDEATGQGGDMLDLIQMALNLDRKAALREACAFLGLADETPRQAALRKRETERLRAQAKRDAADLEAAIVRKRRAAHALWLRCHERIIGTPVAKYLTVRAIGIERLGRSPHALRYHPALHYHHEDKATGEITEGEWPAMVAAIHGPAIEGKPAEFWGVHRTWLAQDDAGIWGKAPLPQPRKVFGSKKGGFIRIWKGFGPRGGVGPSAASNRHNQVFIAEGIEDALSMAVIRREAGRPCLAFAALDLGNIQHVTLTRSIRSVWIIADNDADPGLQKPIDAAVRKFQREGRHVDVWRNRHGGKDANDLVVARMQWEGAA